MVEQVEKLWDTIGDRLNGFIRKRIHQVDDAEDLLQEVFVRIIQHIDQLKDQDKMVPWVYRITNNVLMDYWRATGKQTELANQLSEGDLTGRTVAETEFGNEVGDCLLRMLKTLPENYQNPLRLVELEDFRQTELAEHLGVAGVTARSQVQRARKKLKKQLLDCCHVELDRYGYPVKLRERCSTSDSTSAGQCNPKLR